MIQVTDRGLEFTEPITDQEHQAFDRFVDSIRATEREAIVALLHTYVAKGDPALIAGVDRAIQIIQKGTLA